MRILFAALILILGTLFGVLYMALSSSNTHAQNLSKPSSEVEQIMEQDIKKAIFAGGCFWCIETDFEKLDGVVSVVSGYAGGTVENPSYQDVVTGQTGHYEVVEVSYDPSKVTYADVVEYFFRHVDPFDAGGQFCDRGQQYSTAIFTSDPSEKETISKVIDTIFKTPEKVATSVLDAAVFYPAEDYHQDYAKKNPMRYKLYRWNCGRDAKVKAVWESQN